jgi:hypothetical protein
VAHTCRPVAERHIQHHNLKLDMFTVSGKCLEAKKYEIEFLVGIYVVFVEVRLYKIKNDGTFAH